MPEKSLSVLLLEKSAAAEFRYSLPPERIEMNVASLKIAYALLFLFILCSSAFAAAQMENSVYELSLAGVHIGDLSLTAVKNGSSIKLGSEVSTKPWASVFYEVRDTSESILLQSGRKDLPKNFPFVPSVYKVELNEGPHKIRKEFRFDYSKKTVAYNDILKKETGSYALNALTFDPLSALYYIRRVPLNVGQPVFINVFNNKKIYRIEVQVLRKEQVKTPAGTFNTIVVRSNMDDVGDGIIYYPGDIYLWLNDDPERTPVIIEKRLTPLVEGRLPDFIKGRMPDFLKEKIATGAVRAVLVK